MGATKGQGHKRFSWVFVLLVSGVLYAFALATEVVEEEPMDDEDEETSVCEAWGRPRYIVPSEGFGLSIEVQCIIGDTYLVRHDMPGPDEDPDLLRRYLRQGPYENLSKEQSIVVMEEAVRLWPQSHYAHQGLAETLLGGHGNQGDSADKRRAADEFLKAADLGFEQGKVLYVIEIQLPQLLAELGDKENLDRYFTRVFKLQPEGEARYWSYLAYAKALARLGDEQAEIYFQKAIAVSPEGVEDAYEFYARYLLEHSKAQTVLELLTPNSQVERAMYKPTFHSMRCQALEQLGRKAEAAAACQQARDLTPSLEMPNPVGIPGNRPSSRGPRAPTKLGLLACLT